MHEQMRQFVFVVSTVAGDTRYSVIGANKDKAGDEVERFFALDPNFKIKKCKTYTTYMGK